MSRKRRRERRSDDDMNNNNNNNNNDNPMGLNPQLLNMLGANNIDMSKVSQMMAAMNQDGFDINSIGNLLSGKGNQMGNGQGFPGMPPEFSNIANMMGNMNNMNRNNRNFSNNNLNSNLDNNNFVNNNMNNNMNNNFKHKVKNNSNMMHEDENIEMLLAVKSVVNNQKAKFIDKIIEMYKNGEIEY